MKEIKNKFRTLTNKFPLLIKRINKGITNKNYLVYCLDGIYVFRVPRKEMVGSNYIRQEEVIKQVKDLNVQVASYDNTNGLLVTKYISNTKPVSIKESVSLLKEIHSKDTHNIKTFDPFELLETYKKVVNEKLFDNEDVIIEQAKKLYQKYPLVLCHNDVLKENFLKKKDKTYLIDYEYSGLNIELFDVASYLSENELDEKEKQDFLSCYYGSINENIKEDLNAMINMLDLLWSYWAKAMYVLYNEKVFLDIYLTKANRIKNN